MSKYSDNLQAISAALATIIEILQSFFAGLANFTAGFKKQYPFQDPKNLPEIDF